MKTSELFPYVVPKGYFRIPGQKTKKPDLDRWGIVEELGPDLFNMLIQSADGMVRNVHQEHLDELGLSVEDAKKVAIENLRALSDDGESIKRQMQMGTDGFGQIVWMGHWLTASCIVLPELHEWASGHLNTDEMLVSVPQQQFMFILSLGDANFRKDMAKYIKAVVDGMEKLITFDLFLLTKRGLEPYTEKRKK